MRSRGLLRPRKRLGQHFLEPAWADKVVAAIDPRPGDRFLEIGPGPGALTLRLAPLVAHLIAVEIDRDIVAALAPQLPANVDLVAADILEFDLDALLGRGPLRVAGNLPYNISTPILLRLTAAAAGSASLLDAALMVQREVGERLAARPGTGDYGVLAISVQLRADVRRLLTLPPGAFRPQPKVHSAVVRLTFRPPPVTLVDESLFEAMVRSIFTQRRKTLSNALTPFAASRDAASRDALVAAGIDPSRRPEMLSLPELAVLANWFASR